MNHARNNSGFTLVELMLSMTFVSLLLMAISMTVIQISNIYTKGLTMRAVAQTGQVLAQDMRRSIESARPLDLGSSPTIGGQNFRPMVSVGGDINDPDGGRLCTGAYTYIWNNGKTFDDPVNKYSDSTDLIKMIKVMDNGSIYCTDLSRNIELSAASEMLGDEGHSLAIQDFTIEQVTENPESGQALYYITFEIGTNDEEALDRESGLTSIDTSCKPPSGVGKLTDYCAVNKFEFTARAGNVGGLK